MLGEGCFSCASIVLVLFVAHTFFITAFCDLTRCRTDCNDFLKLEEEKVSGYVRHGAEVVQATWTLYHLLSSDAIKTVQICSGHQIPNLLQRLPVIAHSGLCL